MKTSQAFAVATLALASLSLLAQAASAQTGSAQSGSPDQTQQTTAATAAASAPVEMSPVTGELVDKLDTKTAKTGDSVIIKTRSNAKTTDGTEIPKGSKLIGHVTAVKSSDNGDNSQVALEFDRAELKGGQNLAIHSEIQSLSLSDSDTPASAPDTVAASPSGPPAGSAAAPAGMNGAGGAASPSQSQPQMSGGSSSSLAPESGPAAGTVVARTGNIAIRTTSIPGVLLASNEPGQQDPRMAQSSGILLGPKHDIHLDGGTRMVIGVAPAAANSGPK
jgi:hypothetical protein